MTRPLELRRLARDSAYNLIRQGLGIVIGMAISIILARGLGKAGRGVYTLAVLLPDLLVTFTNLGIGAATVYYAGRGEFSPGWIVRRNLTLAVWVALFGMALGLGLILLAAEALFPGVPRPYLLLSLLLIPLALLNLYLNTVLHGLQDFRAFNLVWLVSQLSFLALAIALVAWLGKGVPGAILALLGGNLGGVLVLLAVLSRRFATQDLFSLKIDREYLRHVLGYGLKAHLANMMTFLNYRADTFLLNWLSGSSQVGLYSVAVALGERLWIPSTAIGAVILPRIASLGDDEEARKGITPLTARSIFWFSLLAALAVWVLAEWGIVLLYREEFRLSALALRALLPGIVMFNLTRILANDIAGRGRPELNLYASILALAANLLANLFLIPRWGATGAALASSVSYTFLALLTVGIYTRTAGVSWQDIVLLRRTDILRYRQVLLLTLAKIRSWRNRISFPSSRQ